MSGVVFHDGGAVVAVEFVVAVVLLDDCSVCIANDGWTVFAMEFSASVVFLGLDSPVWVEEDDGRSVVAVRSTVAIIVFGAAAIGIALDASRSVLAVKLAVLAVFFDDRSVGLGLACVIVGRVCVFLFEFLGLLDDPVVVLCCEFGESFYFI